MRLPIPPGVALLVLATAATTSGADPTYWQDVRPVLRKHCTVCHSQKNVKEPDVSGELALDSLDGIKTGGKTPVATAGQGAQSLMVRLLRHPMPAKRMPLDGDPVPDATVTLLTRWIDAGMPEGTRPVEPGTTFPSLPTQRKKTDVVFATKAVLPKSVAKPGQTGSLELVVALDKLSPVAALAFSSDGRFLASGAYGRVVVWDMKAARPATVLTNVLGAVNDLKFSPDGSLLAVSGGQPSARGDIRIFTVADWSLSTSLGGHIDVVGSVAFSPDGRLLASAGFDKTVRVWNLSTRQTVMTFTGHSDFVHAVAFGPKGDWLVTASKDRTARLIDAKTGQSRLTFSGTDQEVLALAVKPDGSQVVTSGLDPGLSWWDTGTGQQVKRTVGHDGAVHELAFSPDGDIVASAGVDKSVRLWNARTIDSQRTIPIGSIVYSVALSPDGKVVAAGSFDGQVRLFEVAAGRQLVSLAAGSAEEWLAVAPEGFAAAADAVKAKARWRVGVAELNAEWVWKAVGQPAAVARALVGEKPGEPAFAGPQP